MVRQKPGDSMKKWDFRNIKIRSVNIEDIDDRTLLLNLYFTQLAALLLGVVITSLQKNYVWHLFAAADWRSILLWGAGFGAAVLAADLLVGRWVPDDVTDDGGVNERMFAARPLWHILLLSLIVAICEEILFRGAVQHAFGAYWTSILFAAIHIRYLRHWLMTGLVFGISYGLGWIYIRTGTLWTPVAAHFLIDFVMGCVIRFRPKTQEHKTHE